MRLHSAAKKKDERNPNAPRLCPICNGAKQVPDRQNPKGPWVTCPQCRGKGYI